MRHVIIEEQVEVIEVAVPYITVRNDLTKTRKGNTIVSV